MAELDTLSLYMDDTEIGKKVLGSDWLRWADLAAALEKEGLPRIDPMTGKRYYPAVKRFLDARHNLVGEKPAPMVDGEETWPK